MAGAIQEVNKLSWSNPSQVTFIIADAPCHGSEFHPYGDSYPAGTPGISIIFARMPSIANSSNQGLSRQSHPLVSRPTLSLQASQVPIDWKNQHYSEVKVYRNVRITSLTDLQNPLRIGLVRFLPVSKAHRTDMTFESTTLMRRAPSPFAEGKIRLAYHGQIAQEEAELTGSSMVMKSFKHVRKGVNDRDQYLKQMEASAIAHFLASEYNKSSSKHPHCRNINVLPVLVVEEVDETNESSGNRRFCAEALTPTGEIEFTKFSNNTGYWDEDAIDETLLHFTKYTHDVTEGYIIVTDLQGREHIPSHGSSHSVQRYTSFRKHQSWRAFYQEMH